MNILDRPDLREACALFALACCASRAHSIVADVALKTYGAHGALISGCVRDHFPNRVKDRLRELARDVTLYSDAAYVASPARVRVATMRKLARAVAARDGSGFYGPQA